jgi:hypothetical protein
MRHHLEIKRFSIWGSPKSLIPQVRRVSDRSTSSMESGESIEEVHIISDGDDDRGVSIGPSISESEVSMHASVNSEQAEPEDNPSSDHSDSDEVISLEQRAEDLESWQEELEQDVSRHSTEVKDWTTLRAQIKADLKKNAKKLPLASTN